MPYKASGKWVLIYRDGRWVRYQEHATEERAKAHAAALNINVTAKETPKRKKK